MSKYRDFEGSDFIGVLENEAVCRKHENAMPLRLEAARRLREAAELETQCDAHIRRMTEMQLEKERLSARIAELEAVLRSPEFHREFANDNGICAPGCPACAVLEGKHEL